MYDIIMTYIKGGKIMRTKKDVKSFMLYLPTQHHKAIQEISDIEGLTMSEVIRRVLKEYIDKFNKNKDKMPV